MTYTNPEKIKYDKIYRENHIPGYGSTCHGEKHIHALYGYSSLIDIGCGDNSLVRRLRKNNIDGFYYGVDLSSNDADIVADISSPDFKTPDNYPDIECFETYPKFDIVTAFDVLEHLRPEQVHQALTNMSRISTEFMFTISFTDSFHTVDGEPLHMTVQPDVWWKNTISKFAHTITVQRDLFTGVWL